MKNTQISLLLLMLLFSASTNPACQKQGVEPLPQKITQIADSTDNTIIDELAAIDVPDVIDPNPIGGTTKIDSITSTRATSDEDALANCSTFKYDSFLKVGYGGNSATLVLNLNENDTLVLSSITSSKPELVKVVDLRKADNKHWVFTMSSKTDTFRAASVRISVTNMRSFTFWKTIKVVGVNENVNTFGTQAWGLEYEKALVKGHYTLIDTSYIPTLGDVLKFGSDIKGVIITNPVVTPPQMLAGVYKSAKYIFNLVQWNANNCTSSRTVKKISTYKTDLPKGILSADAVTQATHFKAIGNILFKNLEICLKHT